MCEESQRLSIAVKAQILDRMAKIEGTSFTASSIKIFVRDACLKTDYEIIDMVEKIQEQMDDNSSMMKRILGDQYEFFQKLTFRETARESTNALNPN